MSRLVYYLTVTTVTIGLLLATFQLYNFAMEMKAAHQLKIQENASLDYFAGKCVSDGQYILFDLDQSETVRYPTTASTLRVFPIGDYDMLFATDALDNKYVKCAVKVSNDKLVLMSKQDLLKPFSVDPKLLEYIKFVKNEAALITAWGNLAYLVFFLVLMSTVIVNLIFPSKVKLS